MTIQAKARYEGFTDLDGDSFSIPLQAMNPKATVPARVFFKNQTGRHDYKIGQLYDAVLECSQESPESPRQYDALIAR